MHPLYPLHQIFSLVALCLAEVNAALPQMPPAEGVMADYTLAKEVAGYVCLLAYCTRLVVMEQQIFVTAADTLRCMEGSHLKRISHYTVHNFGLCHAM